MAEAEDVLVDAARHATIFARDLWQRRRRADDGPQVPGLAELADRLSLFLRAVYGRDFELRVAQRPAPPTILVRLFRRSDGPVRQQAVPATDDCAIWLPARIEHTDAQEVILLYRAMALSQAMRAMRGAARTGMQAKHALLRDVYRLVEAWSADQALIELLPGAGDSIARLRRLALMTRPAPEAFPRRLRPFESWVRAILQASGVQGSFPSGTFARALGAPGPSAQMPAGLRACLSSQESLQLARDLVTRFLADVRDTTMAAPAAVPASAFGAHPLLADLWTGDLVPTRTGSAADGRRSGALADLEFDAPAPHSAQLERRPEVREPVEGEDEEAGSSGVWMVQTAQPHEKAEDPLGLQRPTDRDAETPAEEYADSLSELDQARLVRTPERAREVLVSDDPPIVRDARREQARQAGLDTREIALPYPEWDWRIGAYRRPGAIVRLLPPRFGDPAWVEQKLAEHRTLLERIARQFEVLRARRVRERGRLDGDEIDLDAWLESHADFHAGLARNPAIYSSLRRTHRDLAMLLLIDVSGSTDAWVSRDRRIIDVEREALLLVCVALERMGMPYAVHAFSGESAQSVVMRAVKDFDESYGPTVAQRIAALEPEHFTRAGAAMRHASTLLMKQKAEHRLLLLLSDGKPNDIDQYEGRYGVEDLRQAVNEARLQGISPFCLTIDREAAAYLPAVFGATHYALLQQPERLPTVLLDWVRRLVTS